MNSFLYYKFCLINSIIRSIICTGDRSTVLYIKILYHRKKGIVLVNSFVDGSRLFARPSALLSHY